MCQVIFTIKLLKVQKDKANYYIITNSFKLKELSKITWHVIFTIKLLKVQKDKANCYIITKSFKLKESSKITRHIIFTRELLKVPKRLRSKKGTNSFLFYNSLFQFSACKSHTE